ncbi:hypothetical protein [Streptomyces sp. NPDC051992]
MPAPSCGYALRSRLSDALTGTDLLPVWFTTALGPMAPPRRAEE